jgi:CheY-like chemotaxis protein
MGGEIGVESVPGDGSKFWFTVPLDIDTERAAALWPAGFAGSRVLLIDDHATGRRVLRRQLEAWSLEVAEATNASEALEAIRRAAHDPFDIIMIDLQMPVLDGLGIARGLRALRGGEDTPIVMMSSVLGRVAAEDSEALNIAATLTKPVHQSELLNCLTSLLCGTSVLKALTPLPEPVLTVERLQGRVLIVEDNPVNQTVARGLLEQLGCETASAYSGREAVDLVRAESFDIVLMDCQMPEMDGFTATGAIRDWEAQRGRERLPIVALTANALAGYRERCMAAGMDDYLAKPFTLSQLRDVIVRHMRADTAVAAPASAASATASERRSAPAEPWPLDRAALDALRGLPGVGATLLQRVIDVYLGSSGELARRIHDASVAADGPSLGAAAHALKSSSANVGANELARLCLEVERLAERDLAAAARAVDSLRREYGRVIDALRHESEQLMQGAA